ncbi:18008_t:CDS:2, partial [Gigaspora margarita]
TNYKVLVYELPLEPHEACIGTITAEIVEKCILVKGTNAGTRADHSGKEADSLFHPMKPRVLAPTGSDRKPNIIVEVTYFKSIDHDIKKVKNYWLKDLSYAHDAIVVKIDLVAENITSSRMRFEFGTYDGTGNALNILWDTCLIKINLDCLYYQAHPD